MSATHNAVLDELVSALDQLQVSRYLCGMSTEVMRLTSLAYSSSPVGAFVLSLYDGILLLGDGAFQRASR
jgi:hypothetical protein